MTNEKELRDWKNEVFIGKLVLEYGTDEVEQMLDYVRHSHTQEVVEKIEPKLSYALYNLKNSIRHEREGTNIHGHENDLDRDLQDLDDVLALLKEDNNK